MFFISGVKMVIFLFLLKHIFLKHYFHSYLKKKDRIFQNKLFRYSNFIRGPDKVTIFEAIGDSHITSSFNQTSAQRVGVPRSFSVNFSQTSNTTINFDNLSRILEDPEFQTWTNIYGTQIKRPVLKRIIRQKKMEKLVFLILIRDCDV